MRPLPHRASPQRRLAAGALAGALALGLTACSAGDSGSSSDSAGGSADSQQLSDPQTGEAAGDTAAGAAKSAAGSGTVVAVLADRKLVRSADVDLRVQDVADASARLRSIAAAAGGVVVSEQVSTDDGAFPPPLPGDDRQTTVPKGAGVVTISVPTERLDATVDEVAKVGTVLSRSTSTQDVTGQYVDVASRVKTMQASVDRVRALMSKADKIGDIVSLEAELSRRQADLEATQRRLAALEDQVQLAPITVRLDTATSAPPTEDPTGFLAGLASGWEAFTTSMRLLLTLVGALVPFAAAGAIVIVPLVVWLRRRSRPGPSSPTPPPAAPAA